MRYIASGIASRMLCLHKNMAHRMIGATSNLMLIFVIDTSINLKPIPCELKMTETTPIMQPEDLMAWSTNAAQLLEKTQEVMSQLVLRHSQIDVSPAAMHNLAHMGEIAQTAMNTMMTHPEKIIGSQMQLWQDYATLCQKTSLAFLGQPIEPVIEAEPRDKRFKHEGWQENPLFSFIKQYYLLMSRFTKEILSHIEGLDEKTEMQLEFLGRQFIDALAPSNFITTNPEILDLTFKTRGENLIKGLENMLEDMKGSDGPFLIKMTDLDAFEVGKNVAITPGKIVFQNEMLQLIQYNPTTEKVAKTPLLVVPPWINKYYILDLRPDNSFVKWATEQGYTVFLISWRNVDEKQAHIRFDDYITLGTIAAMDAIESITHEKKLHTVGFCIGGTLLACTLAYLSAIKQQRVASATYFATLIDFAQPGELGVFIDETQLDQYEAEMLEKGFFDGRSMALAFNLLRDNDLIWSYFVNNYLAGREPFPFDLLFWNSDSTNIPAKAHAFYLRSMYLHNLLAKPAGISLNEVPINIEDIKVPAYFISTIQDHIAPWKSTYSGALLHKGKTRFVLGGSGHIAGIVNPPHAAKYGYWVNEELASTAEEWFANTKQHEGSWWLDWKVWIDGFKDTLIPARVPQNAIEDAPGSYVKRQLIKKIREKDES